MLHHRGQRHRERPGDLRHGELALLRQPVDDRPPRRVGKRREGEIELGLSKVNHLVKYCHSIVALSRMARGLTSS